MYFKSLTASLRYYRFYLPFLLLLSRLHVAAQPVRVDLIIEGFLALVPCTEYKCLVYCFSFLRGTTPIFDVYFTTTLNTERRLPKFERNKFILTLCEEANINLILDMKAPAAGGGTPQYTCLRQRKHTERRPSHLKWKFPNRSASRVTYSTPNSKLSNRSARKVTY